MDRFEKKHPCDIYIYTNIMHTTLTCLYNKQNSTEIGFKCHTTSGNVKMTHVLLQFLSWIQPDWPFKWFMLVWMTDNWLWTTLRMHFVVSAIKDHEYGSTLRVRFVFLPNYWTIDFPLKRCNICQLNKGKRLHTQRSATNAHHLNQDAYLSNWLQPTHMEFFVFPCCLLITAPMLCKEYCFIYVFFSMDEQKVTSLDELQWKIEQHRKQYMLFHCPNKYNQFKMA